MNLTEGKIEIIIRRDKKMEEDEDEDEDKIIIFIFFQRESEIRVSFVLFPDDQRPLLSLGLYATLVSWAMVPSEKGYHRWNSRTRSSTVPSTTKP